MGSANANPDILELLGVYAVLMCLYLEDAHLAQSICSVNAGLQLCVE